MGSKQWGAATVLRPKHWEPEAVDIRGYPDQQVGAPAALLERIGCGSLQADMLARSVIPRSSVRQAEQSLPAVRPLPGPRAQYWGCCKEASPPAAHNVHHSLCQCGPVLTLRRDLRALFTVDRGSEPLAGMRICVVLALVLATATVANGNLAVPFPFGSPQAPQPV